MSSSKDPGKPYSCSHTKFFVVTFLSHIVTLIIFAGIFSIYATTNHRLVDVEDRLRVHDEELKSCCRKEMYANVQVHDGIKVTPDKGNTGETQITNRVKRSTSNISPDVLDSIRVEVRNQVLNLTASLFCQAPDKTCVRGAPGMRGLRGRRGSRGRRGRPGPKGTKGLPGKYGKQGFRGPPGLKGQKGDIGNPGPPGLTGPKGDRGEKISQPSALVSPSTLTVTENQTATFHCNAHGNPKPKITWKKEYGKIDIGKARIDKSGLFEISNVDENDTGNYTCTAKNVLGEDARTISVLVRVPPRFTVVPEEFQTVTEGSTVNLTCSASGYPTPVITWSRLFGSFPSERSVQRSGKLTIKKFRRSDGVTYQCKAVNLLGSSTPTTVMQINFAAVTAQRVWSYHK
ncbi:hemicentin-1 [Exaiptasia diaphana]|uniref:Ig-like domain-containing protein n=1 Tax=Exaiptasia diaphana TaxID=2652724 RepID=A0A913YMR7_EXADI|nr:hemicentin-1 [Exaiptasia diaphana]